MLPTLAVTDTILRYSALLHRKKDLTQDCVCILPTALGSQSLFSSAEISGLESKLIFIKT